MTDFYDITEYPCGGGFNATDYIRLEDAPKGQYGTPITPSRDGNDLKIEILWADGTITMHENLKYDRKQSSFYDRDARERYYQHTVVPLINIVMHGSTIPYVKLNEIENIKVRIIKN
mgnify:CR=1 FL=1